MPRPAGPSRTPYGHARPAGRGRKVRFLMFGIPYLILHGLGYGLMLILGFVALALSGGRNDDLVLAMLASLGVVIIVISVVLLTYSIAAGIMAIKGKVAGVWMGLCHVGLLTLLQIVGFLMSGAEHLLGFILATFLYFVLIALGILDLRRHAASKTARGGVVQPGMPAPAFAGQSPRPPAAGPPRRARGPVVPAPAVVAAPEVVAAPPVVAQAISPADAFFRLLRVSAGLEPDYADERIQRARLAAIKVFGEAKQQAVMSNLGQPEPSANPHADAEALAAGIASNAKLASAALKAAAFTLKEEQGYTPEGKQFLHALKAALHQNGVAV